MSDKNKRRRPMVPAAEETKAMGTDGEKSERLHSTGETGEPTQGTRRREGGRRIAEPVEGNKAGRPSPSPLSTGLDWVAEVARRRPNEALTTLAHHITPPLLRRAYQLTRRDGAAGVDGKTWKQYGQNLEDNLEDLHGRFRSGRYVAPPVKRVRIPKRGSTKTRPIGIPTLEDKVLQRAVLMVLEPIYEQQFRNCSYGFRPGRSPHQALEAMRERVMQYNGATVLDVDIEGFFDNLDHGHLRAFLDTRVRDGTIRKTIDKWIKAGILDGGQLQRPTKGTPQGGVISPLMANIYLHHVLDTWFEDEVCPRLHGRAALVRYADDAMLVFEREEDARRVMEVLPKRLGKYGLQLNARKTRTVPFRRPGGDDRGDGPGAVSFLGFTLYWGRSRNGKWVIKRKTAKDAFHRVVMALRQWLMRVRHQPVDKQHVTLCRKVRGHDAYYGVTGNARALQRLRHHAARCWQYALNRRAQKHHMPWPKFRMLLEVYPLPPPRITQSIYRLAASP